MWYCRHPSISLCTHLSASFFAFAPHFYPAHPMSSACAPPVFVAASASVPLVRPSSSVLPASSALAPHPRPSPPRSLHHPLFLHVILPPANIKERSILRWAHSSLPPSFARRHPSTGLRWPSGTEQLSHFGIIGGPRHSRRGSSQPPVGAVALRRELRDREAKDEERLELPHGWCRRRSATFIGNLYPVGVHAPTLRCKHNNV